MIQVVEHHDDGHSPVPIQARDQLQKVQLVPDVQEGGGLVQEEDLGPLGESKRHPGALALTPRQRVDGTVDEVVEAGHPDGVLDCLIVLAAEHPERADMGKTALLDQLQDGEFGRDLVHLREDRHLASNVAGR